MTQRRPHRRHALVLLALVGAALASGCASSRNASSSNGGAGASADSGGAGSAPEAPRPRPSRMSDVITADEIRDAPQSAGTAYDLIQQLRPRFLQPRGVTSGRGSQMSPPSVYVDNVRFGDLRSLRDIARNSILEIRYLNPSQATSRFTLEERGGAIVITSKK